MLVAQSCPTLCDPNICSLPGSSVHRILQVRIPEWVAIPFSRGSSQPGSPALQADSLPSKVPETEKAMAPHSSTLVWKIPWAEEPGMLQSMGSLRVRHD